MTLQGKIAYAVLIVWTSAIVWLAIAAAVYAYKRAWRRVRLFARTALLASFAWPLLSVWFGLAVYDPEVGSKAETLARTIATSMNLSAFGLPALGLAFALWITAHVRERKAQP